MIASTNLPASPSRAPRGLPWLGHVSMLRDPLTSFEDVMHRYGDVVRLKFFGTDYMVLSSPSSAHHVLVEHVDDYPKSPSYDGLRLFLGNGLVTSEGTFWRRQRKLIQPAFHRARLAGFAATMVEATDAMLVDWERRADVDPMVDIHQEMTRLTFRIVGRTLFGIDLVDEADEIGRAVEVAQHAANDYAVAIYRPPLHWPTPGNRRIAHARKAHDDVVYKILAARRLDTTPRHDLLAMLLEARDEETGDGMTDEQLRDEMVTLIGAGHETTSNALAWTFYHLGLRPDVLRTLARSVREVLGDRAPTVADLPALDLARRVVEEAMRLHPPVSGVERIAARDDVIDGHEVPKGALVGVMTWNLHRHPALWPDPMRFDPDRFLPEAVASRPKLAYMPFGAGPRICIGNTFALMEAQLLLCRIVQRWRPVLDPRHPVVPQALITLRPRYGVRMRLERA